MCHIERIQIFGARCSGNTRLRNLLAKNFLEVSILPTNAEGFDNFGWKHGQLGSEMRLYVDGKYIWLNDAGTHFLRHEDDNPELDIHAIPVQDERYAGIDTDGDAYIKSHAVPITCSDLLIVVNRNPIAWLQSMYRTPYHALTIFELRDNGDLSFGRFIQQPWRTWASSPRVEENIEKRQKYIDKRIMLEDCVSIFEHRAASLTLFNRFFQNAPNVAYVTHEYVNRSPKNCVNQIAAVYGIKQNPFDDTTTYKGRLDTKLFQLKPTAPMRSQDLRSVMDALDWGLEEAVGYKPEFSSVDLTKEICTHPDKLVKEDYQLSPRFYKDGGICTQTKISQVATDKILAKVE